MNIFNDSTHNAKKASVIKALWLSFLVSFSLYGCTTHYNSIGAANFFSLSPSKDFVSLGVHGYQQTTDYTCGPASVMSLLAYYHILTPEQMNHATELKIAGEMHSTESHGTQKQNMVSWLRAHGFVVKTGTNGNLAMLRYNLAHHIPTLVDWSDWGAHWVVVTAYYQGGNDPNEGKDTIFFADPAAHMQNVTNPDGITGFVANRFQAMWYNGGHIPGIYITAVPAKSPLVSYTHTNSVMI